MSDKNITNQADKDAINAAKKKYADAQARGDTAGMESAHAEAEAVRSKYNYSGGEDGSQSIKLNNEPSWLGAGGKGTNATTASTTNSLIPNSSFEDDVKRLSDLQKKQQVAQFKKAKQKALDNLAVQEQEIKPMYEKQRNLASASSQQGARSFAEYLANRGLTNSGAAAQGEMNRLSTLQKTLGQIGTAEANAYRDIAKQRTAIENDYVTGLASANAQIEADYFNRILQENQRKRLIGEQLMEQSAGQYVDDYQAEIDRRMAINPNDPLIPYLLAQRGQKMNANYAGSMNNALTNIQAGNINYNNAAAVGMTVPQAQAYYNNIVAQQQAQAQKEAEQQAFENYIKQQQLINDTKRTNYDINKPYYKESGFSLAANVRSNLENQALPMIIQNNPNATDEEIAQYINNLSDEELLNSIGG